MKRSLLPLLALTLLLGACNTTATTKSARIDTNPAVPAGKKITQWGELPSYEPAGHHFIGVSAPNLGQLQVTGELKLDVLVNPDGSVQDVAVFESSGDPVVDRAAASAFRKARYSLQLSPADPSPYVVRLTMGLRTAATEPSRHIDATNYGSLGPQPNFSGPPAPSYSGMTSNP